ncbi:MAG: efflux transporter periplasmic adaptor subunit, partial [Acinetobacter sp.]
VNAKGQVEPRPITTVGVQGTDWIVTQGLQTGEKVIVDGLAKVKPEQAVVAKPYQPQAAAPQAGAKSGTTAQPAQQNKSSEQKATSNT